MTNIFLETGKGLRMSEVVKGAYRTQWASFQLAWLSLMRQYREDLVAAQQDNYLLYFRDKLATLNAYVRGNPFAVVRTKAPEMTKDLAKEAYSVMSWGLTLSTVLLDVKVARQALQAKWRDEDSKASVASVAAVKR